MKPPKCPNCGKELTNVIEDVSQVIYNWNPENFYIEKEYSGKLTNLCPFCNADLYDLFPDGVCNYFQRGELRLRNKKLLQEAIESLEKAKCDFWACPGPDEPFEDMMTCHTCYALQCLQKIIKENLP